MNVGIVNYGLGNINSIRNAVLYSNSDVKIQLVEHADQLKDYDKIILPGVGAFKDAIKLISLKNFDEALILEKSKGKYILGICLGMQLLATKSYEFGEHQGLNFIEGEVLKLNPEKNQPVPHIGWNNVNWDIDNKLFQNINNNSDFYFVHSYHFKCKNSKHSIGKTNYIENFTSIVKRDNIIGTQFHPEKSQLSGLKLIENFINL